MSRARRMAQTIIMAPFPILDAIARSAIMETMAMIIVRAIQRHRISSLSSLDASKDDFTREVMFSTSLYLYRKRKLSLGKAAELAGYTRMDFIQKLQEDGEFIFDYTDAEIDEIFQDAQKF